MIRPTLQLLFLIALGLAASYYWDPTQPSSPDPQTQIRLRALPNSYIYNPRSTSYDSSGVLTQIIEATSIYRFSHGNESQLENPHFYAHSGDDRTWSSIARKGRYLHDSDVLILSEDVVLTNDQSKIQLKTEKMRIDLEKNIARTFVPVTMTQGLNNTRADSMFANLNKETVQMKSNVKSVYVQP